MARSIACCIGIGTLEVIMVPSARCIGISKLDLVLLTSFATSNGPKHLDANVTSKRDHNNESVKHA